MIELEGLAKTYRDGTQALHPLDLSLEPGVLGLLGPNGAGKTTLLSILVLALDPSAGRRRYFGLDDQSRHRPEIRSWIGYLPQEYQAITQATGLEYLMLCGEIRGVPLRRRDLRRRAEALLELVDLSDAAHRPTGGYSGGMARRLGLAQSLLHRPRVLVVDEPTAGLDPEERIRFRNIVTDVGDQLPVVLSTHIVEDIEATCPRLAILSHGHLVYDGPPGALFENCRGRVWLLPEQDRPELPRIGRRSSGDDPAQALVLAPREPRGSTPRSPGPTATATEPNLEEAYAAFLADRTSLAESTKGLAPPPGSSAPPESA